MSCRHWEVISELTFTTGGWDEPPEDYNPWIMVEADTKKEARVLAIQDADFGDHAREMRGDGKPPMSKLIVRRCECEHGVRWCCGRECSECLAAAYE